MVLKNAKVIGISFSMMQSLETDKVGSVLFDTRRWRRRHGMDVPFVANVLSSLRMGTCSGGMQSVRVGKKEQVGTDAVWTFRRTVGRTQGLAVVALWCSGCLQEVVEHRTGEWIVEQLRIWVTLVLLLTASRKELALASDGVPFLDDDAAPRACGGEELVVMNDYGWACEVWE